MSFEKELKARSESKCELCSATENLTVQVVAPTQGHNVYDCVMICNTCSEQVKNPETINANHWRCLNDSMWNPEPAVQVMAWRMLNELTQKGESWAQDLMEMMYMDEETTKWAKALEVAKAYAVIHKDVNGVQLQAGDSVILVKDLNVKGANFIAKRGTAIRRITLDKENAEHIEGRINGQHIVILTQYVKKTK